MRYAVQLIIHQRDSSVTGTSLALKLLLRMACWPGEYHKLRENEHATSNHDKTELFSL